MPCLISSYPGKNQQALSGVFSLFAKAQVTLALASEKPLGVACCVSQAFADIKPIIAIFVFV